MNDDHTNENTPNSAYVQSVGRALTLLQLISTMNGSASVEKLCQSTGLNRTTVWRLLNTMEYHGFVYRNPSSKTYELGLSAANLGSDVHQRYAPLIRLAGPIMKQLRDDSQESVMLAVPYSSGILTIEQFDSQQNVRVKSYLNFITPIAACTSTGKLMISRLPSEEQEAIFQTPAKKYTSHTITDPQIMRKEIAKVTQDGYGIVVGEMDESENAISAVINYFDQLYAFLSVCGPSYRFTRKKMLSLASRIQTDAQKISASLSNAGEI